MPTETWTVYKKTKHRLGFRRADGSEFRLPRKLLPDRFSVDADVECKWRRGDSEAELAFRLITRGDATVAGRIGQAERGVEVHVKPDRWIVWRATADRVGVTGATGELKETGQYKIPPNLLPAACQVADSLYVQSVIGTTEVGWLVVLHENQARTRERLLKLVE